jgi:hypothetical protein
MSSIISKAETAYYDHLSDISASGDINEISQHYFLNYAHAVPNESIIAYINQLCGGSIIELGCGTGLWSACLGELGCHMISSDLYSPGSNPDYKYTKQFWSFNPSSAEDMIASSGEQNHFLVVAPDQDKPWPAYAVLQLMRDPKVAKTKSKNLYYIGEPQSSPHSNKKFCATLKRYGHFKRVIPVSNFPGFNNSLWVIRLEPHPLFSSVKDFFFRNKGK